MDDVSSLASMGLALPSPAYIAGVILFSLVGYVAYRYGKKQSAPPVKWIGIALMLYSYVTPETWMMYAVGAGLCAALYFVRT